MKLIGVSTILLAAYVDWVSGYCAQEVKEAATQCWNTFQEVVVGEDNWKSDCFHFYVFDDCLREWLYEECSEIQFSKADVIDDLEYYKWECTRRSFYGESLYLVTKEYGKFDCEDADACTQVMRAALDSRRDATETCPDWARYNRCLDRTTYYRECYPWDYIYLIDAAIHRGQAECAGSREGVSLFTIITAAAVGLILTQSFME